MTKLKTIKELEINYPLEVTAVIDLDSISNDVFIERVITILPGIIKHMRSDKCSHELKAEYTSLLKRLLHAMCGGEDNGVLGKQINVPIEIADLLELKTNK